MDKRDFLKKMGIGGVALGLAPSLVYPNTPLTNIKAKNWIWMTPREGLSQDQWKKELDKIKAAGFDALLFESYNGRKASFEAGHLPQGDPILNWLINHAKEIGLEVHAWMFSMPCNIPEIVEKNTDWYSVNRLGQPANTHPAYVDYYKFLSPSHPDAMDFVQQTVATLSSIEGLTGVHLDYIRLPDVILAEALQPKYNLVQDREMPEYDYCYHPLTRERFEAETGIDPLKDLEDPSASSEWRQFRYDLITGLVNERFLPEIKKGGKTATAAVFPNWESVRQQWSKWNLDAFFPMLYHNFYNEDINWVGKMIREEKKALVNNAPIYSGLFVPELDERELQEAKAISMEAGASGISLFQHWSMEDEHWNKMASLIKGS